MAQKTPTVLIGVSCFVYIYIYIDIYLFDTFGGVWHTSRFQINWKLKLWNPPEPQRMMSSKSQETQWLQHYHFGHQAISPFQACSRWPPKVLRQSKLVFSVWRNRFAATCETSRERYPETIHIFQLLALKSASALKLAELHHVFSTNSNATKPPFRHHVEIHPGFTQVLLSTQVIRKGLQVLWEIGFPEVGNQKRLTGKSVVEPSRLIWIVDWTKPWCAWCKWSALKCLKNQSFLIC